MRRSHLIPGVAGAALLMTGAGFAVGHVVFDETPPASPESAVLADGLDLLASETAADWTTSASVVAVVTVVEEQADEPDPEELERGEGEIGRTLVLRVDEALWSKPGQRPPDTISLRSEGWVWKNHDPDQRVEFGMAERPRLEVGNQYLAALAEFPGIPAAEYATCDDNLGENPTAAAWGVIGTYGAAPVADGVIGPGEFEGAIRTLDEARAAADGTGQQPLRDTLLGQPPAAVVPHLERAAKEHPPKPLPVPTC